MEKTLVIIKPDAIQRGLIFEILGRFERKGIRLCAIKMVKLDNSILDLHYKHLSDRPFFHELKAFMMSTPVIVTCWEGFDCVATVRRLCGITNSREAEVGTVRGDFAMSIQANLVHASDTKETAEVEIQRFFHPTELYDYELHLQKFVYSSRELQTTE